MKFDRRAFITGALAAGPLSIIASGTSGTSRTDMYAWAQTIIRGAKNLFSAHGVEAVRSYFSALTEAGEIESWSIDTHGSVNVKWSLKFRPLANTIFELIL